jgi:hypothetical protein
MKSASALTIADRAIADRVDFDDCRRALQLPSFVQE